MKKIYLISFTLFVCTFIPSNSLAQISGTVTINSASATAGTNYQSFSALANQLNSGGVSGPLYVNVVANSGPYIEQPVFLQTPGVSNTNSILINGNNNSLSFSANTSAQPWTLLLKGADYMTFNYLNVAGQGSTYALACIVSHGANHNTFNYCSFMVPANSSGVNHVPVSISGSSVSTSVGTSGDYNRFSYCTMINGAYRGIYVGGSPSAPYNTNNLFQNCTVSDWGNMGVEAHYQQNLSINNCSFSRPTRLAPGVGTGIYFYNQKGGTNCIGNCISNFFGATTTNTFAAQGIVFSNSTNGIPTSTISNNVISSLGGNGEVGIGLFMMNGVCNSNTIILNSTVTTSLTNMNSTAIAVTTASSSDSLRILDNYISISQSGTAAKIGIGMSPGYTFNILVNRNKFYFSSTNSIFGYGANGSGNTFATWQSIGYDVQGTNYSVDPNPVLSTNCGAAAPALPQGNFTLPTGSLCVGSTLTFSDNSSNSPSSWSWSVNPQASVSINASTSQNPQITFGAAGVYTVLVIASNSSGPGSPVTKTITIYGQPNILISANNAICFNTPVSLIASGALTYTWSNGTLGSVVSFTPSTTTSYTVVGTGAGGCMNSTVKTVIVSPLPLVTVSSSSSVICAGETVILSATGANYYLWNTGSAGSNLIVQPTVSTSYSVVGTDVNGCSNSVLITQTVNACTGISGNSPRSKVSLYPNPNNGKFTVRLAGEGPAQISICNPSGLKVFNSTTDFRSCEIDISGYPNGVYFIEIKQDGYVLKDRILKL